MGAAAGYVLACRILGPDMVVRTAWTSSTPTLSGNAGESESARFFITCRCCWVQSYSSSVLAILATIQANSSPWRPVCGSAVLPILGFGTTVIKQGRPKDIFKLFNMLYWGTWLLITHMNGCSIPAARRHIHNTTTRTVQGVIADATQVHPSHLQQHCRPRPAMFYLKNDQGVVIDWDPIAGCDKQRLNIKFRVYFKKRTSTGTSTGNKKSH